MVAEEVDASSNTTVELVGVVLLSGVDLILPLREQVRLDNDALWYVSFDKLVQSIMSSRFNVANVGRESRTKKCNQWHRNRHQKAPPSHLY